MDSIEVVHEWTKERATLPVEVVSEFHIRVRWGMAGIYELDIRTNKLRSVNPAVRRKHPYCLWSAVDIDKVRREHWEYRNPGKKSRDDEAFKIHQEGLLRYARGNHAADGSRLNPGSEGKGASPRRSRP